MTPALALGWQLPISPGDGRSDPAAPATLLLAELLAGRPDAALPDRLIRGERSASQIAIVAGFGGRPFESRDPDLLALTAVLTPGADPVAILDTVGQELAALAAGGPDPRLLARTVSTWTTSWVRSLDPLGVRAPRLGAFELLHGGAELALDLPRRTAAVGPDDVAAAAARLAAQPRRWITISTGKDGGSTGKDQT